MKKAFTLIEILVVTSILSLLISGAIVSYSILLRQSRDGKRKTDLEQVRAALEIYRSNNNTYPVGTGWTILNALTAPTVYIQSLPLDPKNPTNSYYYTGSTSDYTLGAYVENGGMVCVASQCGSDCTYCVGPYGQK